MTLKGSQLPRPSSPFTGTSGNHPWANYWMINVQSNRGLQFFTISGTMKRQRRAHFRIAVFFIGCQIIPSRQLLIQLTHSTSLETSVFILLWWKRFIVSWISLFRALHSRVDHYFHPVSFVPALTAYLTQLSNSWKKKKTNLRPQLNQNVLEVWGETGAPNHCFLKARWVIPVSSHLSNM